jgi:CheY-like chemotaxis protein
MSNAAPRVLVVDDDRRAVDRLTDVLEGMGCIVVPAGTPEEGLAVARITPIRLAVFDMRTSGRSALEAARRIRLDPHLKSMTLIAATTPAEGDGRIPAGFDARLASPIDLALLQSMVQHYLFENRPPR